MDCGYIVDELEDPRCPECGRPFDPADPTTFYVLRRSYVSDCVVAFVASLPTLALVLLVASRFPIWTRPSLFAGLIIVLPVGWLISAAALSGTYRSHPRRLGTPWPLVMAIGMHVLNLLGLIFVGVLVVALLRR